MDRIERDAQIVGRVRKGETLESVARDYGITRERVRQLVKPYGIGKEWRQWRANMRATVAVSEVLSGARVSEAQRRNKISFGHRGYAAVVVAGRSVRERKIR